MTINADPTHQWPSKGVFYHEWADYGGNSSNKLRIDNCTALNLPPNIVFVEIPEYGVAFNRPTGDLVINNPNFSVYGGGKLATFVRAFNPRWYGRISGCTNALTQYVNAWIDDGDVIPWFSGSWTNYDVDDLATHKDPDGITRIYRCIRNHGDSIDWPLWGEVAAHEPAVGTNWQSYWVLQPWCNIKFIHPDFTALPTTGNWVQGSDIVQIPGNPNGTTEYQCVQSGNGTTSLWAPVATTPPTVTLTGPSSGSYLPGCTLTLTATASATTGSISHVDFYQGSTLLATGTPMNGVYTYVWSNVPVGNYTLTAKAYDSHAAWTVSNAANIIVASIPTDGLLLWLHADAITGVNNGGAVTTWNDSSGNGYNALYTDLNGEVAPTYVTNVYNGLPVVRFGGDNLLQVSALPLGPYTIAAVFKTTGNQQIVYEHSDDLLYNQNANFLYTSTNSTVSVKRAGTQTGKDIVESNAGTWAANLTAPLLTVDEFGGTDASEQLFINGSPQWLNENYVGNLNNSTVYTEPFNIGERAQYAGNQFNGDIAEIVVYDHVLSPADLTTLTNTLMSKYALETPPTVSLTAPSNGAVFTAPASITLSATATANNGGSISKVEFYNGTTLLGTSASSPYSYTWTGVAVGNYAITAIAYDNNNFTSVSSTNNITVSALPSTGLLLWLHADAITGISNGGSVNTWYDASGNGYNAVFTQVGGVGVAPLYETNVYNGLPVVRFGGNSLLQVSALPLGPYTIATVFKTTGNQQIVYEHSDNLLSNSNANFLYTSTNSTVSVKRAGTQTGKDIVESNAATWAAIPACRSSPWTSSAARTPAKCSISTAASSGSMRITWAT